MTGYVSRDELVTYLTDLLSADEGHDMCPNGLQVEGSEKVQKVVLGVSSCLELFQEAVRRGADTVLVHHGLFWNKSPAQLVGVQYRRVAELIKNDLNLIAYHLPLDRDLKVGNNAVAAERFGLEEIEPFGDYRGFPIGVRGRFPSPPTAEEFLAKAQEVFAHPCDLRFLEGPARVETLGLISGGAQGEFYRAIDEGLDAFITGEVSEWVMNLARESKTHYVAAGHYATERLGIQALGEKVRERFGVEVEYVDVPNPV